MNSEIVTSDGGLAFAGSTSIEVGTNGAHVISSGMIAWLVKLDSFGNTHWNQTYSNYEEGGRGTWDVNSRVETSEGGFALAGSWDFSDSVAYYYLVKTEQALPTPTPSVPEFSWLIILSLFVVLVFIAIKLRHQKTAKITVPI